MKKEWLEWMKWDSAEVVSLKESLEIAGDPSQKRNILPSRFAYRNKHAGRAAAELRKMGLPLVKAKARLCIQGFRQVGKEKLRRDSPTLSRVGFFVVLQIVMGNDWCSSMPTPRVPSCRVEPILVARCCT